MSKFPGKEIPSKSYSCNETLVRDEESITVYNYLNWRAVDGDKIRKDWLSVACVLSAI